MRNSMIGLLTGLLLSASVHAADYAADVHYARLSQTQPVQTGDKIEVLEVFWYGCPHCYTLEPHIQNWLNDKPANAEYVVMPAILRDSWEIHARSYYSFEALGILDKVHTPFFDAIHKERRRFRSVDEVADWVSGLGVEKSSFFDAYDSFAVETKLRQARVMGDRYELTGVPTMIVDGKYRTTGTMAGGHAAMMDVVNFLVAKAAEERN